MDDINKQIQTQFPYFNQSSDFISKMIDCGNLMEIKGGTIILNVGEYIRVIPFLLDGLIKIYREDDDGNEILLYYIHNGESCVMSITTCLKNERGSIKAIVEEDSILLAIPKDKFINLLNEHKILHTFTYDLFNSKYNELIDSIDSLAFTDTKSRLIKYLNREVEIRNSNVLSGLTHKKIATDLSTSREVVSRLLYALQKEGLLSLDSKKINMTKLVT